MRERRRRKASARPRRQRHRMHSRPAAPPPPAPHPLAAPPPTLKSAVLALKSLQKSMILRPAWPSAGPTGGDGLAWPAGMTSRMVAVTALALDMAPPCCAAGGGWRGAGRATGGRGVRADADPSLHGLQAAAWRWVHCCKCWQAAGLALEGGWASVGAVAVGKLEEARGLAPARQFGGRDGLQCKWMRVAPAQHCFLPASSCFACGQGQCSPMPAPSRLPLSITQPHTPRQCVNGRSRLNQQGRRPLCWASECSPPGPWARACAAGRP